ncbi:hypothetical protein [Parasphingorhabdus sp.]|uniref:hypothetical protein n=1 Tax=Parasphingorhabdus sp. TaxID=2709688 RepID=UPI003266DA22
MTNFKMAWLFKSAAAAGALLSLGGCMYGGGYYGDGYVNNSDYGCDPYAPFDDYYACDNGYGFTNIGFGGGWYDQYYYPGYGVHIFDRGGKRHIMRDRHRRHWARQRAYFGEKHAGKRYRNREKRAERRNQRYERGDGTQNQRRSGYRNRVGPGSTGNNRPAVRAARPDNAGQAAPVRSRSDRVERAERRAARAAVAKPARTRAATRPERTSRPPRMERKSRPSSRHESSQPERMSDD